MTTINDAIKYDELFQRDIRLMKRKVCMKLEDKHDECFVAYCQLCNTTVQYKGKNQHLKTTHKRPLMFINPLPLSSVLYDVYNSPVYDIISPFPDPLA